MNSESFKRTVPVGYLIHEVARLMKRRFEDEARLHNITLPQWRTLSQIAQTDVAPQSSLAAAMDTDPMTMSGILDRLEKRGLIERFADPNDSRAKLARLTEDGQTLFRTARTVGLAMYQSAIDGISAEEQSVLVSALSRMRDNLSGQPAEQKETTE